MKKIAMVILMVLIVTIFSVCAITGTETIAGNNTSASTATTSENIVESTDVTRYNIEDIPFATTQKEETTKGSAYGTQLAIVIDGIYTIYFI